jgi:hypothetical protein
MDLDAGLLFALTAPFDIVSCSFGLIHEADFHLKVDSSDLDDSFNLAENIENNW